LYVKDEYDLCANNNLSEGLTQMGGSSSREEQSSMGKKWIQSATRTCWVFGESSDRHYYWLCKESERKAQVKRLNIHSPLLFL